MTLDGGRLCVVAGMPRGGTTYLYHVLAGHPGAYVPYRKETDYFTTHYRRGRDWFDALYRDAHEGSIPFDISPSYLFSSEFPYRLDRLCPDARVVVSVRAPASMAVSAYAHLQSIMLRRPHFEDFLRSYRIGHGRDAATMRLASGQLSRRIAALREHFGPRLLLYSFSHFKAHSLDALRALESFCGLPPHWNEHNIRIGNINAPKSGLGRLVSLMIYNPVSTALIENVFSPETIRRVRLALDRLSLPGRGGEGRRPSPTVATSSAVRDSASAPREDVDRSRQLELARSVLAHDEGYVRSLFAEAPVVLGDGTPFGRTAGCQA